jgi:hypothetical protein
MLLKQLQRLQFLHTKKWRSREYLETAPFALVTVRRARMELGTRWIKRPAWIETSACSPLILVQEFDYTRLCHSRAADLKRP